MSEQTVLAPLVVLDQIVTILESLEIPYLIGGSFASGAHSQFRATHDIDLLCKFSADSLEKFLGQLGDDFYYDTITAKEALKNGSAFNLIHHKTILKVDIFTKIGPFEELQLVRAVSLGVPGLSFKPRFATAEDIILAKLVWYRKGNEQSERQRNDVSLVVQYNLSSLDLSYLAAQASSLGVLDLLKLFVKF